MNLKVLGSNSAGNCYLLQAFGETLMIECGIHINKVKQALKFNLSGLYAICTHSHGDHAKYIKDILKAGINVYAGKETFEAMQVSDHHRAKIIDDGRSFQIGGFKLKPFEVNHDVRCFGYIIQHEECGRVLFLTDTYYCDYTFPGLNNIIVECNHAEDIIESNGTKKFLRDRIIEAHMNIDTCKNLLLANDLTQVNNIVLIHLSTRNSDARRFKREIAEMTGKDIHIADAGLCIEFNKMAI